MLKLAFLINIKDVKMLCNFKRTNYMIKKSTRGKIYTVIPILGRIVSMNILVFL